MQTDLLDQERDSFFLLKKTLNSFLTFETFTGMEVILLQQAEPQKQYRTQMVKLLLFLYLGSIGLVSIIPFPLALLDYTVNPRKTCSQ